MYRLLGLWNAQTFTEAKVQCCWSGHQQSKPVGAKTVNRKGKMMSMMMMIFLSVQSETQSSSFSKSMHLLMSEVSKGTSILSVTSWKCQRLWYELQEIELSNDKISRHCKTVLCSDKDKMPLNTELDLISYFNSQEKRGIPPKGHLSKYLSPGDRWWEHFLKLDDGLLFLFFFLSAVWEGSNQHCRRAQETLKTMKLMFSLVKILVISHFSLRWLESKDHPPLM